MGASDAGPQPDESAFDLASPHRQDFDHDPRDDELTRFVHLDGLAAWLRVVETPREVRVEPGTIPLWFVAICTAPVAAVWIWIWHNEFARGGLKVLNDPLKAGGLATTVLAFPATIAVIVFINRHIQSFGTFCVLDLVNSILELPRQGLSLNRPRIVRFIEFRGWRCTTEKSWTRELSVIARNEQGSFCRYQVVIGEGWPVSRIGRRLAGFFDVELTVIKDRFFASGHK